MHIPSPNAPNNNVGVLAEVVPSLNAVNLDKNKQES